MRFLRAIGWLVALLGFGSFAYIVARRIGYPYDLEWMEGGMLCHALRLLAHKPIYAPPSVDFIPYLYTPLYPMLLAALSKFFGLGYVMARVLSVLSIVVSIAFGAHFVRTLGGPGWIAALAMAILPAAFVPTGSWLDLARPDSLWLALVTTAVCIGWLARETTSGPIAAGLLLVLAFFTKQTAAPFMPALALALLIANRRAFALYVVTMAVTGLPALWWFNHESAGWFWTYIFKLHQGHDFFALRAFYSTPLRMAALIGPALLLIPIALVACFSPTLLYITFMGLVGLGAACLSFATQWAFWNAFMPGVFFLALAVGAAASALCANARTITWPAISTVLLIGAVLLAPGILVRPAAARAPKSWGFEQYPETGYDPRPHLPTAHDRALNDALIARLRSVNGEVLIPFHPYYAHLAGKETFLHRMGVMDVSRAGLGAPKSLVDAIDAQRFALIVMDNRIDGTYDYWPHLLQRYEQSERIAGARTFSGAATEPRYILVPKKGRAAPF